MLLRISWIPTMKNTRYTISDFSNSLQLFDREGTCHYPHFPQVKNLRFSEVKWPVQGPCTALPMPSDPSTRKIQDRPDLETCTFSALSSFPNQRDTVITSAIETVIKKCSCNISNLLVAFPNKQEDIKITYLKKVSFTHIQSPKLSFCFPEE